MEEVLTTNKISWEIRDGIGFLSFIDIPENRMDSSFFQELQMLTTVIIPGSKVTAVVISGSGRHFSSGADLEDLLKSIENEHMSSGPDIFLLWNYNSLKYLRELNIPVIAAIKGVCLGAALELAMHCHFRLCTPDAIFGLPESGFGLIPGMGGIPMLLELAGKAKTMELILKGNTINAKDALKWNIVDAVYHKKDIVQKAVQLAKIASANYRKYNKTDYLNILNARAEVRGN